MKQKENLTNKIKHFFKKQVIKLFNNYPRIERAFDICDEIFQKLILGYIVDVVLLLLILFGVVYATLPNEIKEPFSPVISIIITAILIPFFLNAYSRKKENDQNNLRITKSYIWR